MKILSAKIVFSSSSDGAELANRIIRSNIPEIQATVVYTDYEKPPEIDQRDPFILCVQTANKLLERVKASGDVVMTERSIFMTGPSLTTLWLNNSKGPSTLTYSALSLILQNLVAFLKENDSSIVNFLVLDHIHGDQRVLEASLFRRNYENETPDTDLTS